MKLATLVAATLGLAHDVAEETITAKFEEAALALAKASGAQTLGGAVDVLRSTSAELETLRLAHDAEKAKADAASAALAKIEGERRKTELAALIDGAVTSGRLAPAKRAQLEVNAEKFGIEWARAAIDMLPVSSLGAAPPPAQEPTVEKLDAELKAALLASGVTEEDLKAARAAGCA